MASPLRLAALAWAASFVLLIAPVASAATAERGPSIRGPITVGYSSEAALDAAVSHAGGRVLRRLPHIHVAEVSGSGLIAELLAGSPGISFLERPATRTRAAEPGLARANAHGAFEWQYAAAHADTVPESVRRAASAITIAVIDTGADLRAPDLAAKSPFAFDIRTQAEDVADVHGHGTFVASLAAGSTTNGEGIAGFSGDANLLVVRTSTGRDGLTDVDEAAAIVYAVDQGARVINLSFGGPSTSTTERRAIDYAAEHGVLLIAAIGNDFRNGNPVHYPAALLQPVSSRGHGGRGLAVGASRRDGTRAAFSNTGSHLSLVAPGEAVFGAVSELSSRRDYPRVALPGSREGLYGFGSGTSYSAPQVAGAAVLVWTANPALSASDVADYLKGTASGQGRWNPRLGYGVLDVGAAVALALASRP
ncbi:MAG: S8 family serine peptidase [Actinomycetota bacterium]